MSTIERVTFIHAVQFAGDTGDTWTHVAAAKPSSKRVVDITTVPLGVKLADKYGAYCIVPMSNVKSIDYGLPDVKPAAASRRTTDGKEAAT